MAAESLLQFTPDTAPTMDGCVETGSDVSSADLLNGLDDVSDGLRLQATSGGGSSGSASLSSASSHETVVSVGARQPETRDHHPPDDCDLRPQQPETVCCNGDQSAEASSDEVFRSEMSVMSPLVNRWRRRQQAETEINSTSGPPYPRWSSNRSDASSGRCAHGYSSDTEAFLRTLNRRGTTSGPAVTVSGLSAGQSPSVEYGSWQRDLSTNVHRTSSPTSIVRQQTEVRPNGCR